MRIPYKCSPALSDIHRSQSYFKSLALALSEIISAILHFEVCLAPSETQGRFSPTKSIQKKSRIRETPNLSTDADHRTNIYIYICVFFYFLFFFGRVEKKLDGVGPVDNRPSTNQLHHFFHFRSYDVLKIFPQRITYRLN